MMFRLSCLYPQVHGQKRKKQGQPSFETLLKTMQNGYPNPCLEAKDADDGWHDERGHLMVISSVGHFGKSQGNISNHSAENNSEVPQIVHLRRSRSLGSELDKEGGLFVAKSREDFPDEDEEFSCDGSHHYLVAELSPPASDMRDLRISSPDREQEGSISVSPEMGSDHLNHEFLFSVGDRQDTGKDDHESHDTPIYFESTGDSGSHTPAIPMLARASSMPNIGSTSPTSGGSSPCTDFLPRNGSFMDLNIPDVKMEGILTYDISTQGQGDAEQCTSDEYRRETLACSEYGYYDCGSSSKKEWIMPVNNEIQAENYQGSSSSQWDQFQGGNFKLKRIEDWVIDLHNSGPVEETWDNTASHTQQHRGSGLLDRMESTKLEARINPDMNAANKYIISSLNPTASTFQLANLGLAVIPFLGAFVSLKVLNLSGNSVVRITAGALPRGLHVLNLSKNKISTIEGLRELTRLRVLDLSYNRIVRIGRGLASCSSLKELYLAGNKISEVEGLHRFLRLSVLDLRYNKLSTSKSLGQLAANYNSLQAISVEGNPSQKNIGDEQLKKYLQGLLPHLAYYNGQPVKSSKESGDRSVRLGVSSHQHDRFSRPDHKPSRKGSHSLAALKQTAHVVESPKRSRGRHGQMPPSATKTSHRQHHQFDFGNRPLGLSSVSSIQKSQSVGSFVPL